MVLPSKKKEEDNSGIPQQFNGDTDNLQIIGLPTIIGEGYAGGFKHTLKAWIIQTKTGFDYVYQNQ